MIRVAVKGLPRGHLIPILQPRGRRRPEVLPVPVIWGPARASRVGPLSSTPPGYRYRTPGRLIASPEARFLEVWWAGEASGDYASKGKVLHEAPDESSERRDDVLGIVASPDGLAVVSEVGEATDGPQ